MTPGYRALREGAAWLDLSQRGKIAVRGPDRTRLIHAITTNDIRALVPGTGCYTLFLNAQGRVLADANVFCLPDEILLDTEPETRFSILTHIGDFTIADDALTVDLTPTLGTIAVEGPKARQVLQETLSMLPVHKHGIVASQYGWVARASTSGQPGWLVFTPSAMQRRFVQKIESAGGIRAESADARVVRIENRIPRFGEEITPRFLAPEVGDVDAISRNKGCYLGQEVVERIRSRNVLSRRLTAISFDSGAFAKAGTKLHDHDVRAGEIVSAVYSPWLGQWIGLAYIRVDLIRQGASLSFDGGRVTIAGDSGETSPVADTTFQGEYS
jgi:folate-binding protein YgfZ